MKQPKLTHVCGRCDKSFGSDADYIMHVCKDTGLRPGNPKHFEASGHPKTEVKDGVKISDSDILSSIKLARKKR